MTSDKQETPRTDAASKVMTWTIDDEHHNLEYVAAELSRQLERELADMTDDYFRLLKEKQDALDAEHLPSATSEIVRKAKLLDDMERIGLYPVNETSLVEWAEREIRKHDNSREANEAKTRYVAEKT